MIDTDYILNNTSFNLIALNPVYQLLNTNPIETDFYSEISSINYPQDTFINPLLDSQYNILDFNNSIGYMQKAYQTLDTLQPYLDNLNTLSEELQTNPDNTLIKDDMQDIYKEINELIQNTTYDGVNVFNNDIQIGDTTIKLELPELDINNPESIENFTKQVDLLKDDIKNYLENSSLYTDNFIDSLNNEISLNDFDLINEANLTNLSITADLLAQIHNQDYLSQNLSQLLL